MVRTPTLDLTRRVAGDIFPKLVAPYILALAGRNIGLFGSFSLANWYERMLPTRQLFQRLGCWAMTPRGEKFVSELGNFEILDADQAKIDVMQQALGRSLNDREIIIALEGIFLSDLERADICYLVADERPGIEDGGYIGLAAALELSIMTAAGKPVVASRPISPSLDERDGYCSNFAGYASMVHVATPQEVVDVLDRGGRFVNQGGVTKVQG